jgi:hypothetical protein
VACDGLLQEVDR